MCLSSFIFFTAKYELQKIRYLRHNAVPSQNLPVARPLITNIYAKHHVTKPSSARRSVLEVQENENVFPDKTTFLEESIEEIDNLEELDEFSQTEYLDDSDENILRDESQFEHLDENSFTARDTSPFLEDSISQVDNSDDNIFTARDESPLLEDSTSKVEYLDELDENICDIKDNLKSTQGLRRYISVLLTVIKELEDKNVR